MKKIFFYFIIFIFPINCFALTDNSKSCVAIDIDSGRILYEKNKDNKQLIASITKIMTCIVTLENSDLNDTVKVGEEILKMYGTNIYLELGEKITVKDLLYGLMLRSGNDAAITLATYVAGSEEKFVKMMNEKAIELGMNNTVFSNSHGLDDDSCNYSTAYDMAILSKYAFGNKKYREIISTKRFSTKSSIKSYYWINRMSLLNDYKYCIGGKNGYTPKAGKTLVSLASKNDLILSVVSLDDNNIYDNHKDIYEMLFDKYKKYLIIDKDNFNINSYFYNDDVYIKKSFYYTLSENEINSITTLVNLYHKSKNNIVGEVIIKLDNYEIGRLKIYKKAKKKKEKSLFRKIIFEIF